MKVKELLKYYPNYKVIEMGYPGCTPFTMLPKELDGLTGRAYDKVFKELEVKGYKVNNKIVLYKDITESVLGIKGKSESYKGTIEIYLKGDKR